MVLLLVEFLRNQLEVVVATQHSPTDHFNWEHSIPMVCFQLDGLSLKIVLQYELMVRTHQELWQPALQGVVAS